MNGPWLRYSGPPLVEKCVNNAILGKKKAFDRARGTGVQLRNTKDKDIKERERTTGGGNKNETETKRTKKIE
jgi:hypothetical protein